MRLVNEGRWETRDLQDHRDQREAKESLVEMVVQAGRVKLVTLVILEIEEPPELWVGRVSLDLKENWDLVELRAYLDLQGQPDPRVLLGCGEALV